MSQSLSSGTAHIATVTLNRPERLNALDKAMWQGLRDAMRSLDAMTACAASCCAAQATRRLRRAPTSPSSPPSAPTPRRRKIYGALIHEAMQAVAQCKHPTVALIQGACIGGGLEIAAMCDLRICGASSRFGVPINSLGLTMAYGELQGPARACRPRGHSRNPARRPRVRRRRGL